MEFFLVPLLAIAGVTVGINKLARLFFHIRLSWKLLAMLVGFAWLISLVLPGMFFHSAGFAGSKYNAAARQRGVTQARRSRAHISSM